MLVRIIFFAGKGGVGKTSVAAATGVRVAEMGKRTVIMSLDVAHSLSDIFDLKKSLLDKNRGKPIKVSKNLWIQEMDVQEEIENNWGDIYKYISTLLNTTGLDEILAEELAILPGMEEVSLLLYINRYVRDEEFDVIILDCAPTGESIRFISIPTTLEWYIRKIFKMERTIAKYVGPVAKRVYGVPIPGDDYFAAVEYLFQRLRGVDEILTDPQITTVRLITNPEKIVLKETQRAFMYFCLYKMSIDGIIMIPVFSVNLFRSEVLGYESLKLLAAQVYGKKDPLKRFFKGEPYNLIKENGEYRLTMKLPFLMKEEVELNRLSDELIVRVGSFKRHVLLPRQVAASKSVKAALEGEFLHIHFRGDDHGQKKG